MELTVSSYMSPWTSFDYSLNLKIRVCGKWSESTIRSDKPIDLTQFARDLAELNANSDEVLLDISNVPDGMMVFEVRVAPYEGQLAVVDVQSTYVEFEHGKELIVTESSMRELVPLHEINATGNALLASANGEIFKFDSSADR